MVKNHARGNDQMVLDRSVEDPGFEALPTMGEILTPERLGLLSDEDLEDLEMAAKGRSQEVDAEVQRRHAKQWGRPGRTYPREWKD